MKRKESLVINAINTDYLTTYFFLMTIDSLTIDHLLTDFFLLTIDY